MYKYTAAVSALALLGAPAMSADVQRPIQLRIERHGDFLDVVVVNDSGQPADAQFELELASSGPGGTAKTVQSGNSRGRAPETQLLSSRIRTSGLAAWNARLHVTIAGREYVELKSS